MTSQKGISTLYLKLTRPHILEYTPSGYSGWGEWAEASGTLRLADGFTTDELHSLIISRIVKSISGKERGWFETCDLVYNCKDFNVYVIRGWYWLSQKVQLLL